MRRASCLHITACVLRARGVTRLSGCGACTHARCAHYYTIYLLRIDLSQTLIESVVQFLAVAACVSGFQLSREYAIRVPVYDAVTVTISAWVCKLPYHVSPFLATRYTLGTRTHIAHLRFQHFAMWRISLLSFAARPKCNGGGGLKTHDIAS